MPGPIVHLSDLLTPQELQVALAVSNGATNREVASALFLSQKTVEFHLTGIYRRLAAVAGRPNPSAEGPAAEPRAMLALRPGDLAPRLSWQCSSAALTTRGLPEPNGPRT
jgi:DNA-binding NarL/FixJ family response regulator